MLSFKKIAIVAAGLFAFGYGQSVMTPASAIASTYSIAGAKNPDPAMRNRTVDSIFQSFDELGNPIIAGKVISTYDGNGCIISQVNQTYDSKARLFVDVSLMTWNYADGLVNESSYRVWDAAGNLITDDRKTYSYFEDGLRKQVKIQKWIRGLPQADSSLKILTYAASGLLMSYQEFNYRVGFPAVQYKTTYRYDAQNRLIEGIFQFWDYTMFVNEYRTTWTYSAVPTAVASYYYWSYVESAWVLSSTATVSSPAHVEGEVAAAPENSMDISPNPFNPQTRIRYSLNKASPVALNVYNAQGVRVRAIKSGFEGEGLHSAGWDGRNDRFQQMPSGLYIIRLQANGKVLMRKAQLVK